jgi:hypothetical protein
LPEKFEWVEGCGSAEVIAESEFSVRPRPSQKLKMQVCGAKLDFSVTWAGRIIELLLCSALIANGPLYRKLIRLIVATKFAHTSLVIKFFAHVRLNV